VVQSAKQQKRIPFGALVESGMLKPGTRLFGPARKVQARVRADGSLKLGTGKGSKRAGLTGSIHKMGAAAQGAPSCNGWTFWHVADGDTLVPIDDLRQKIRRDDA
ncbi:MAG: site-specific DNA-methyltransferase, partial [Pseudomonadota bacterium]|nr:site-specific DNA-methyltransferase [Pseudomonadota bacterium]